MFSIEISSFHPAFWNVHNKQRLELKRQAAVTVDTTYNRTMISISSPTFTTREFFIRRNKL